jgi:hypothetical protein
MSTNPHEPSVSSTIFLQAAQHAYFVTETQKYCWQDTEYLKAKDEVLAGTTTVTHHAPACKPSCACRMAQHVQAAHAQAGLAENKEGIEYAGSNMACCMHMQPATAVATYFKKNIIAANSACQCSCCQVHTQSVPMHIAPKPAA